MQTGKYGMAVRYHPPTLKLDRAEHIKEFLVSRGEPQTILNISMALGMGYIDCYELVNTRKDMFIKSDLMLAQPKYYIKEG